MSPLQLRTFSALVEDVGLPGDCRSGVFHVAFPAAQKNDGTQQSSPKRRSRRAEVPEGRRYINSPAAPFPR